MVHAWISLSRLASSTSFSPVAIMTMRTMLAACLLAAITACSARTSGQDAAAASATAATNAATADTMLIKSAVAKHYTSASRVTVRRIEADTAWVIAMLGQSSFVSARFEKRNAVWTFVKEHAAGVF